MAQGRPPSYELDGLPLPGGAVGLPPLAFEESPFDPAPFPLPLDALAEPPLAVPLATSASELATFAFELALLDAAPLPAAGAAVLPGADDDLPVVEPFPAVGLPGDEPEPFPVAGVPGSFTLPGGVEVASGFLVCPGAA